MFENIDAAARAFYAVGVRKGDIVTFCTVTIPETIYSFYALNKLGAIANIVDPRTSSEGLHNYINEVDSKVILCIDAVQDKIEKAIHGTNVCKIIVQSPSDSLSRFKRVIYNITKKEKISKKIFNINWKNFIKNGKGSVPTYSTYEKNTCVAIEHTGGTTGLPKGVMLSNENINSAVIQTKNTPFDMQRNDTFLNIVPPFVAYGLVLGIHNALSVGWNSILIPKFDVNEFDTILINYKPNVIMGAPIYFDYLMNSSKMNGFDLSFIKIVLVGGDKTSSELENRTNQFFEKHGCNIHLSKGYSMTEASSTATCSFENVNKVGSNGIPLTKTVIAAFDPDTGNEVVYNEVGEICIKTPTMMICYFNNPQETDFIIRKHKDGTTWLHSGDFGYVDEEGFVFINGRIKRMIIRPDGYKVFPPFIENAILLDSRVESCCVVGKRDNSKSQGFLPVAYIVQRNADKNNILKDEIKELCEKELPEYMIPIDYIFIDALPLTAVGKVDYRKLEQMAENRN